MKLNREFYIPKDYVEYKPQIGDYPKDMFAVWVSKEKPSAMFFIGKQSKPTWHFSFKDNEAMKAKIHTQISNLMSWEERKVADRAKRSLPHTLKDGDILYSSWGYDQTNIDFYQVTKVISDKSVEIKQIHSTIVDSSEGYSNKVMPVKDSFFVSTEYDKRGDAMLKRVSANNQIRIESYSTAWLWDGTPRSETASGYGH